MKKSRRTLCIALIGLLCSCNNLEREVILIPEDEDITKQAENEQDYCQGILRVKLTPELESQLSLRSASGALRSGNPALDNYLQQIGAHSMTRVFPEGEGAIAKRRREAGLHLWYDIQFDDNIPTTRAASDASTLEGVEVVEKIALVEFNLEKGITAFANPRATTRSSEGTIPNDPKFQDQWHHHNDGSLKNSMAGIDINSLEAWKVETGKPNVIVAVLDDGMDFNHPDLKSNLWVNTRPEYDDDIHGYNFSMEQVDVEPNDHGTHVAGLVAATRNNGIGVAGVAGGDGSENSGVKLMGLQIISSTVNNLRAVPKAFVYAADHGAVIAQNSWTSGAVPSVKDIPRSFKEGIDYFIKYAGVDPKTGQQLKGSPMKGGVVIFAAGNNNRNSVYMPSGYEPVIAVASVAASGKRAFYSNHGSWIDISAPGGDWTQGNPDGMILSTFGDGLYGYMQGTSMACPLVSGVAALIVSKYGGDGFTNEDLKSRLLGAVRPFNIDVLNPLEKGWLGVGMIDASKALDKDGRKAPSSISNIQVRADYEGLELEWKAVQDEDDGTALSYIIHYTSDMAMTSDALLSADYLQFNFPDKKAGELIQSQLNGLKLNTRYKLAIRAKDRWGHLSNPYFFEASTRENAAPQLTPSTQKRIRLVDAQSKEVTVSVHHPDALTWNYHLYGDTEGVSAKREGDNIIITFRKVLSKGSYKLGVKVADKFGSADLVIPFDVVENHKPLNILQPESIYLPLSKEVYEMALSPCFEDPDGDILSYEVKNHSNSLVKATVVEDKLKVEALQNGTAHLEIIAKDLDGSAARMKVEIKVVKDDIVYVVYPVPVAKDLNIRLSDEVYSAQITILTPMGAQKMRRFVKVREDEDRQVVLNVSELEIGSYVLEVTANGKVFKQNIIKN
ncbi:S8 family serine peptidase [Porphyromonas levii]|uniref:T9SS type A sorting domain-containing protein n=1 Tax=Porphyromonas levii TaxID=28114 RepID=A0A4Y8WP92_9PORP|nr:S8 family serine peptidase [Porphyromonas levii]TFH94812.1 hypothetical protein E4P47_06050 [Porphyromonas levii]TFH95317.1 hypothetical protein E4P48_08215 [Porphyromonas levii]